MSFRQKLQHKAMRLLAPPVPLSRLNAAIEDYMAREGARRIGESLAGTRLETLEGGHNQRVKRWSAAGREPLIVRAWRYHCELRPAREHVTAGNLLTAAGLRPPRVELCDDSFRTRRRWRIEVVVEEQARGRALRELVEEGDRQTLESCWRELGRELAMLHAYRSAEGRWGRVWRDRNGLENPRQYFKGRLRALRRRLPGHLRQLRDPEMLARLDELEREYEALGAAGIEPRLIHGDLSIDHVFRDADGQLTWIDFGTVQFGHPANDLSMVRSWSFGTEAYRTIAESYVRHGGDPTFLDPPTLDLFEEWRLWERMKTRLRKRLRQGDNGPSKAIERLMQDQLRLETRLSSRTQGARAGHG